MSERGDKENFDIRIRPVTGGYEVELEEVINLYAWFGTRNPTKRRRTTWTFSDDFTIDEIHKICKSESIFNDDYGRKVM